MKVNGIEFSGQGATGGMPYTIAAGTEEGDAVTLVSGGMMGRGADGAPFEGVVLTIEKDGRGTVGIERVLHPRCVAGLTVGRKGLVVDGAGRVKAGAAGAGRSGLVIAIEGDLTAIDMN